MPSIRSQLDFKLARIETLENAMAQRKLTIKEKNEYEKLTGLKLPLDV
jgi:hypothetical protein